MKSSTNWGYSKPYKYRALKCPACKHLFIYRDRKKCPQCSVGLYALGETIYDNDGYIWHPGREQWIKVKDFPKTI